MSSREHLTVGDLWAFDRIGALARSPDNAQAVASVTAHSMEENRGRSSLWLLSTFGDAPRCLTH